jgi:hypothetical protein
MPQVIPPPVKPIQTDIELFAKAYFNIELTSQQLQYIAMVASGTKHLTMRITRRAGISTANKVIFAYLQEGLRRNGRARLPQHPLPPMPKKLKGVTQAGKILNAIKRPGGAYNWQLSRIALKYTSVISDLRKDGHDIEAIRQYNKKGKATDTWLYICHD